MCTCIRLKAMPKVDFMCLYIAYCKYIPISCKQLLFSTLYLFICVVT